MTTTEQVDDLVTALTTAATSVFRLEARQDYPDDSLWLAHQRGEDWESDPELAEWCDLVSATTGRDVMWIRARVVTDPWTPYTRWEIAKHFPHNIAAGEDIALVTDPELIGAPDFYLIDDTRGWVMQYDTDGNTTGVQPLNEDGLRNARGWRDFALRHTAIDLLVPQT